MSKAAKINNKKKRDEQKASRKLKNSLAYNTPGPKRISGNKPGKIKKKSNGPQNQYGTHKKGSNKGILASIKKQKKDQAFARQELRNKRTNEDQLALISTRTGKKLEDLMHLKEVKRLLK